jgi:hypothetical protein
MKATVLDAHDVLFDGVASLVTLPGLGGEKTLMDYHEPLFLVLARGTVVIQTMVRRVGEAETGRRTLPQAGTVSDEKGEAYGVPSEARMFKIRRGLARMRRNELIVLVE